MVIKVSLGEREREQYYDARDLPLTPGVHVIVEHAEHLRVGKVVAKAPYYPRHKLPESLKPVLRLATPEDLDRARRTAEREEKARQLAAQLAAERDLCMKIVHAQSRGEDHELTILFTADARVDFRDLVRTLSHRLRARIEMKQIGVRDEAAITGAGVGSCGLPLCCKSWLPRFHPVTMKMVKLQNLSPGSTKITGVCGRLKCCIAYEYPIYSELARQLPKVGQPIDTPRGPGIVQARDIPREAALVRLDSGEQVRVTLDEIIQIAAARYHERGGGHPCTKCGDGRGCASGGCGGGGCGTGACRATAASDDPPGSAGMLER
jgi:cell fate regulator YaaT (PSP1 superfamily)